MSSSNGPLTGAAQERRRSRRGRGVQAVTAMGPTAETEPHDHVVELIRRGPSGPGPRTSRDADAPNVVVLGADAAGRVLADAASRFVAARRLLARIMKS